MNKHQLRLAHTAAQLSVAWEFAEINVIISFIGSKCYYKCIGMSSCIVADFNALTLSVILKRGRTQHYEIIYHSATSQ